MWKPKKIGAKYWSLSWLFEPQKHHWYAEEVDLELYSIGNVFKSRKEALNFAKVVKSLRDNETLTKLMRGVR
jgi:hypothetical protein